MNTTVPDSIQADTRHRRPRPPCRMVTTMPPLDSLHDTVAGTVNTVYRIECVDRPGSPAEHRRHLTGNGTVPAHPTIPPRRSTGRDRADPGEVAPMLGRRA